MADDKRDTGQGQARTRVAFATQNPPAPPTGHTRAQQQSAPVTIPAPMQRAVAASAPPLDPPNYERPAPAPRRPQILRDLDKWAGVTLTRLNERYFTLSMPDYEQGGDTRKCIVPLAVSNFTSKAPDEAGQLEFFKIACAMAMCGVMHYQSERSFSAEYGYTITESPNYMSQGTRHRIFIPTPDNRWVGMQNFFNDADLVRWAEYKGFDVDNLQGHAEYIQQLAFMNTQSRSSRSVPSGL